MLYQLCSKTIWHLKRSSVLFTQDPVNLKNLWEEFCFYHYCQSEMLSMSEDYVRVEIAKHFDKLKEIDRFETWLETQNAERAVDVYLYEKFEAVIPLRYLNINVLNQEIGFDKGDVYDEIYNLVLEAARDYADLKYDWHYYG